MKNNKKVQKVLATGTNFQVERNELEQLFLECIDQVRRQIMKQRLKT